MEQVKIDGELLDLEGMDIEQLHQLEKKIHKRRSVQVKVNAHNLLVKELDDKYEEFIKTEKVEIMGSNGKRFVIHINGFLEVFNGDKLERTGQLFRNGYPAQDAIVTFAKFARFDADKLEVLWGCGNISVKGGEIESK